MPKIEISTLRELSEGDLFVFINRTPINKRKRFIVCGKNKWSHTGSALRQVYEQGVPSSKISKKSNLNVLKITK